jgi:hypothetical protein
MVQDLQPLAGRIIRGMEDEAPGRAAEGFAEADE